MKNIIKISIALSLMILTSSSFAQTFGIKAGFNLSDMLIESESEEIDNDFNMSPGFHLVGVVDFLIDDAYEAQYKLNLHYPDIPVAAKMTYNVEIEKEPLEWGLDNGLFKRLDYALQFVGDEVSNSYVIVTSNDFVPVKIAIDPGDITRENRLISSSFGATF